MQCTQTLLQWLNCAKRTLGFGLLIPGLILDKRFNRVNAKIITMVELSEKGN